MAQSRLITDLVELVKPNNDDVLVIVDNTTNPSLSVAKKIKYSNLIEDLQDMIDLLVQEGTGIDASYSDVGNTLTLSVVADTTTQKTIVSTGGTDVGTRQELNFIPGAGITLTGADNTSDNRVDLTVNTIAVISGATLSGTGNPISPLGAVAVLGDGTKRLDFRGIKAGSGKIAIVSGDAGNTISIDVVSSGININDLNTSSPLAVTLGGTNATTAGGARANLGAAKVGLNSDITELTGLTTPLSVAQGGIGADTALQGLKNLEGLKYVTSVTVAGQSLVVNDTTLVSNEYRGEFRGIKAASSKISVTTDGNDIAVEANPDDILSASTQNVNLNSHRITNLATPVSSSDAATRAYVDQVSAGLIVKASVNAATTSGLAASYLGSPNFTLTISGTSTPVVDGLSVTATGTSVLIKNQATALQNGIYTLTTAAAPSTTSAVFTRRADSNSSSEVIAGTFTFVTSGATNASKQFVQTAPTPTLDTDALVYSILNDATLADGSVENIKLDDMPALTIKGAVISGEPQDLTANQAIGILNSGTTKLVAAVLPGSTTAASGIVQLYNNVDSVSASAAATANAVKTAYDAAITASGAAVTANSAAVTASGIAVAASGIAVAASGIAAAAMPKAGGTFTGTVFGVTAASGVSNTELATTAFVSTTAMPKTGGTFTGAVTIATNDATIYGMRVGRGAGAIITNTAVGNGALSSNTTGNGNTANGYFALSSNTNGNGNTAIGLLALQSNIGGYTNTAIGYEALGSNTNGYSNTANGYLALYYNTTGSSNTANGYEALGSNTTGYNNTANGYHAGYGPLSGNSNTTGSNNTFIGFQATGATSTVSNSVTLGNNSIATLRCQVTTITSLSDERDKTNITNLGAGLDFISKLRPVSFTWNTRDGAKTGIEDTGFIAQELLSAQDETGTTIPNLVSEENPDKLEAGYGTLIPVLVNAVQELTAMVKQLQDEITTLKGDN